MSVMIRYRDGNSKGQASTTTQKATSLTRQRLLAIADAETSLAAFMASPRSAAAEQAVRAPDQDHDHHGVDYERPHLGHVIFSGDVADAEQQRGEERPGDAGGSA